MSVSKDLHRFLKQKFKLKVKSLGSNEAKNKKRVIYRNLRDRSCQGRGGGVWPNLEVASHFSGAEGRSSKIFVSELGELYYF